MWQRRLLEGIICTTGMGKSVLHATFNAQFNPTNDPNLKNDLDRLAEILLKTELRRHPSGQMVLMYSWLKGFPNQSRIVWKDFAEKSEIDIAGWREFLRTSDNGSDTISKWISQPPIDEVQVMMRDDLLTALRQRSIIRGIDLLSLLEDRIKKDLVENRVPPYSSISEEDIRSVLAMDTRVRHIRGTYILWSQATEEMQKLRTAVLNVFAETDGLSKRQIREKATQFLPPNFTISDALIGEIIRFLATRDRNALWYFKGDPFPKTDEDTNIDSQND